MVLDITAMGTMNHTGLQFYLPPDKGEHLNQSDMAQNHKTIILSNGDDIVMAYVTGHLTLK